jgi:hypothetical protein
MLLLLMMPQQRGVVLVLVVGAKDLEAVAVGQRGGCPLPAVAASASAVVVVAAWAV